MENENDLQTASNHSTGHHAVFLCRFRARANGNARSHRNQPAHVDAPTDQHARANEHTAASDRYPRLS